MSSDLKVTNIKHGSSSSNNLVLASDGTTSFNGNVGIGTSSPFSKLDVTDTSWSSGSPYGTVAYIAGGDVNDANWGHVLITQSGTSTGSGGKLSFGANGANPISQIRAVYQGATYGDMAFYTRPSGGTNTERMRINSSGHVGIGVTDPGQNTLYVKDTNSHGYIYLDNSSTSNAVWMVFNQNTTGSRGWLLGMEGNQDKLYIYDLSDSSYATYVSAGGTDWTNTSDERIKKDITSMENRLDDLLNIDVRRFKWKRNDRDAQGFIAQELVKYAPEAVDVGDDELITKEEAEASETLKEGDLKNPWGISKVALIPMMIKSIQELSAKVTTLENATN